MTTLKKSNEISQIVREIQTAKKNIVGNYVLIGSLLYEAREKKLWKTYNPDYKVFDDFIKELGLGRSTAFNCLAIVEKFGKYLTSKSLDGVEYTRLVRLLPIAKDNIPEWLHKAKELPNDGFDDEIREAQGKTPRDTCEHKETKKLLKCQACGRIMNA